MYLSNTQADALGTIVATLTKATNGDTLRSELGRPLLTLLGADQYCSMVWSERDEKFGRFASENMSTDGLVKWDSYYKQVDPLTFPLMKKRIPTLTTEILPQHELVKTEFFADFLAPEKMYWGVNVYFFDDDECVGDFRIFRSQYRENFGQDELDILNMIRPGVESALSRLHRQGCHLAITYGDVAQDYLQRTFLMSPREAEVAWLVAGGEPDKRVASRLHISIPTVRFHLGNIFSKMRVGNRTAMTAHVRDAVGIEMSKAVTKNANKI